MNPFLTLLLTFFWRNFADRMLIRTAAHFPITLSLWFSQGQSAYIWSHLPNFRSFFCASFENSATVVCLFDCTHTNVPSGISSLAAYSTGRCGVFSVLKCSPQFLHPYYSLSFLFFFSMEVLTAKGVQRSEPHSQQQVRCTPGNKIPSPVAWELTTRPEKFSLWIILMVLCLPSLIRLAGMSFIFDGLFTFPRAMAESFSSNVTKSILLASSPCLS